MLYKYVSSEGIISLENCKLKITPPNQFNDPYEFIPRIIGASDADETNSYLSDDDVLSEHYEAAVKEGVWDGNLVEFIEEIKKNTEDYTNSVVKVSSENEIQWKYSKEFLNYVSQLLGVLCVTKNSSNILMWSHYADSHSGIVIGMDERDIFFDNSNGLYEIEYVTNRPILDLSWLDESDDTGRFTAEIIRKKYKDWAYEQEVRAVFSLSDCENLAVQGDSLYLKKFNPRLIQEVIMGCRCSEETEERIVSLLNQSHYSHVILKKASLDPYEYKIASRNA